MPDSIEEIFPSPEPPPEPPRTAGGNWAFHNFYNDYSHITDPNLRRRLALSEIDKVPFGLYHIRAILVAGVGFFLDSYDIFAINLIVPLLGLTFWSGGDPSDGYGGNQGQLPDVTSQGLKASTSTGIIIGMVLFGWLADSYGRRRMYGIELVIIIAGTFGCSLVAASPGIGVAGLMIFWRILMGIGIGGDYPLSSVITAEFAPTRWRGAMVGAVFSMQGLGQLMAAVVALIVNVAFKESYGGITDETFCGSTCRLAADRSWRIIIGVGAVPACLALYYRITIPETPRYTFDVQLDVEKADADIRAYVSSKPKGEVQVQSVPTSYLAGPSLNVPQASWKDLIQYFKIWKNLKVLIGTSMSWFFLDLAFYGLALNNTIVLHAIGYADGDTLYEKLYNQALGMIILACAGAIPGYWAAVFTMDTLGRKSLQIGGFVLLTILFAVMGFRLHDLNETTLLALYVVAQFLFNAGPNTTTFIVAGECFPTRYRSTAHGISAAMGKLGAIIAQVISIPLLRMGSQDDCTGNECSPYLGRLLQLFALFMLLGALASFLIPETKGLTLEELSGETRTSYNAGCNGSIDMRTSRSRVWNPFSGGQPAGFFYPRSHNTTRASRPRSGTTNSNGRSNIMRRRKPYFWRKRRSARTNSEGANDTTLTQCTSDRSGSGGESTQTEGPPPPSTSRSRDAPRRSPAAHGTSYSTHFPAWGAGWGRIDKGRPPMEIEQVQMYDVGSLMR